MLAIARQRLQKDDEDGFTLIELMVVVLIIAILLAIAIPTFLGAQDRARDRGAQSDLRNGITAAKTLATDEAGLFMVDGAAIDAADMLATEPSLVFSDTVADTDTISVTTALDGSTILLVTESESDTFYGIAATSQGQVTYCSGTAAPTTCTDAEW
jgi:type IV pilus assembly protein PilA